MIRYNAHMMIQQSRMLEAHADMMDAEDEDNDVYHQTNDGRLDRETDNNSCISEHDTDGSDEVKIVPKDEPLTTPPSEMIPYQSSFQKYDQPPVVTSKEVSKKNNDVNNIEKDIKNIIRCAGSMENIDETIFESKIFREADQLLSENTHFSDIIISVAQEVIVPPPKVRIVESKEPENDDEPINLSSKPVDKEVERKLQTFPLVQIPEFSLTYDEATWSDKMYQNISNTMKLLIRPDFYEGVMNLQLGKINKLQFKQV